MNDFEKSIFIFFDEWGGSPHFSCEHGEMCFHGVDVDELLENWSGGNRGDMRLINELFDLGWQLTEDGESFVSRRWGSC